MITPKPLPLIDFIVEKNFVDVLNKVDPQIYVTNPHHGGKVTCHKCNGFILECEHVGYKFPHIHFHIQCYNQYEHYYGLNKSID